MNMSADFSAGKKFDPDLDGMADGDMSMGDMPNVPRELKNRVHLLEDQIAELYDIVADDATRSANVIEHVIIDRPWLSVALAFGLGAAAAALLRPSRA